MCGFLKLQPPFVAMLGPMFAFRLSVVLYFCGKSPCTTGVDGAAGVVAVGGLGEAICALAKPRVMLPSKRAVRQRPEEKTTLRNTGLVFITDFDGKACRLCGVFASVKSLHSAPTSRLF